jgi:methylated-DNA-protein-cysteine methyltransferase-like protein
MPERSGEAGLAPAILRVVRRIPRGRVATYGQVAALAGAPGAARAVGRALRDVPGGSALPWHRVLASPGRIAAALQGSEAGAEQRRRLRAEGVDVDARGRVSLARHGWQARIRLRPVRPSKA